MTKEASMDGARLSLRSRVSRENRPLAWILLCVIAVLVVLPLVLLILYAFRDGPLYDSDSVWSIGKWSLLWEPGTLSLAVRSAIFVLIALLTGAALSVPSAWLIERTRIHGRRVWRALIVASMALAPGVLAFSWVMLGQRGSGALSRIIDSIPLVGDLITVNIQSVVGMGLVGGFALTPTAFTIVSPNVRMIGGDLEEASYACGAGPAETLRRIIAPLTRPALSGALIMMAIIMLGSLEIPAIVGSIPGLSVFADRIFRELRPQMGLPDHNVAAILGILLLTVGVGLLVLYQRAHAKSARYAVIAGRSYKPHRLSLGKLEILAQVYLSIVVLLIMALPVLLLIWVSIVPFYRPPTEPGAFENLSLDVYASLPQFPSIGTAIINTLLVMAIGVTAVMVLGFLTAWISVRVRSRVSSGLGVLAFAPVGIPTVLVAISVFMTYLFLPIEITGTLTILIIAYMTNYVAFAFLFMRAAVGQISTELEEASFTSGAPLVATLRRVTLPLLLPAFAGGWMWIGARVMRDMTIAPVLQSPDNLVIGSFLWQRLGDGQVAVFGAMALALTVCLFVMVFVWESVGGRGYEIG